MLERGLATASLEEGIARYTAKDDESNEPLSQIEFLAASLSARHDALQLLAIAWARQAYRDAGWRGSTRQRSWEARKSREDKRRWHSPGRWGWTEKEKGAVRTRPFFQLRILFGVKEGRKREGRKRWESKEMLGRGVSEGPA